MGKYWVLLAGIALVTVLAASASGDVMGASQAKVDELAAAIGAAEGFGVPGAIPTRSNNPGDLEIGDVGFGVINGKTIFSSVAQGWARLHSIVSGWVNGTSRTYFPSDSFREIGRKYVNGPNAAASAASDDWAGNVAQVLGVDIDSTLEMWVNS